jgi:hypothetical protein
MSLWHPSLLLLLLSLQYQSLNLAPQHSLQITGVLQTVKIKVQFQKSRHPDIHVRANVKNYPFETTSSLIKGWSHDTNVSQREKNSDKRAGEIRSSAKVHQTLTAHPGALEGADRVEEILGFQKYIYMKLHTKTPRRTTI